MAYQAWACRKRGLRFVSTKVGKAWKAKMAAMAVPSPHARLA